MPFLFIGAIAFTLASAVAQSRAQYQMAQQAQANAEHDAQILEAEALEEEQQRAIEAVEERKESTRRLASMEARYAKSGLLMTGTPVYMMKEQAETDEFNILARDRASQIWAENRRSQAEHTRLQGAMSASAYKTQAKASLLSGVASAVGMGAEWGLKIGPKNKPPAQPLRDGSFYGPTQPQMNTIRSLNVKREFSLLQ